MWAWILGGWAVLSIAAVALYSWLRRPRTSLGPEWLDFLRLFEEELTLRHPDVAYCGLAPNRMAVVIRVQDQETPIPLGQLFRHHQAFPDALAPLVDQVVEDITVAGLDDPSDHAFSDVATDVMPQIRSRAWVDFRRFGDGGLVYRSLGDDLVVAYVIDDPASMVFICRAHLKQWGRTEEDLYQLASRNLERLCEAEPPVSGGGDGVLQYNGDGYDAARVLLLDREDSEGLLVAIPDRDMLWVGADTGQDLARLMAVNEELNRNAAHPVSPRLYRWSRGQLEAVSAADR